METRHKVQSIYNIKNFLFIPDFAPSTYGTSSVRGYPLRKYASTQVIFITPLYVLYKQSFSLMGASPPFKIICIYVKIKFKHGLKGILQSSPAFSPQLLCGDIE